MQNEQQHSERVAYCEVRLTFTDVQFGLLVDSDQSHRTYLKDPPGYDDIHCFHSAESNYEKLKNTFLKLTEAGQQCHLQFRMTDLSNSEETLYYGSLNQLEQEGDFWLSSYPADQSENYLQCEAFLKKPDIAEKVIGLIYGGMLASEIDYLSKDDNRLANHPSVQFYRQWEASGMSPCAFILSQLVRETKQTLMEQIQSAEKTVQGEKRSFRRYVDKEGKEFVP